MSESEGPPPVIPDAQKKEMVGRWLEAGKTTESIAMYGTSVENLLQILQAGSIPPFIPEGKNIIFQTLKSGERLYYFLPVFDQLETVKPSVAKLLKSRLDDVLPAAQDTHKALTVDVERGEEIYRINNAFSDFLARKKLLPRNSPFASLFMNGFVDLYYDIDVSNADDLKYYTLFKEYIADPEKKKILEEAKGRRGVTLYYDKSIFQGGELSDMYEDEPEIVIVRTSNLPLSAVKGIAVYTDEERKELNEI